MDCPIVHFEINGPDPAKLQAFYSRVFGWTIKADNPMGYGRIEAPSGKGIGGGISDNESNSPEVLIYIAVDNVDKHLAKIEAGGGKTVRDKTVVPGMVTFAKFRDPQGNIVGIVENEMPPA